MPQHTPYLVWTFANLFSTDECQNLIDQAEQHHFAPASVRTKTGPQMRPNIRTNERVDLSDSTLANLLWQRIQPQVPVVENQRASGVDHHVRFYRYTPGQEFKRHRDGSVVNNQGHESLLSYLVFLNDDFLGGQTLFRFYQGTGTKRHAIELPITPQAGLALLFRHHYWHQGCPVNQGTKYVLRTDIFYSNSSPSDA